MTKLRTRNLIPYPYSDANKTQNGITWTVNSDGSVTAKGSNTVDGQNIFNLRTRLESGNDKLVLPAGIYTISGCPSGGKGSNWHIQVGKTGSDGNWQAIGYDYGNGVTITLIEKTQLQIQLIVRTANDVDITFKPQLEVGDVSTEYVPYEIEVQMTKLRTRNLIPYPYSDANKTQNGITWTVNSDGSVTVSGTATSKTKFMLAVREDESLKVPYGTYTLSGCPQGGGKDTFCLRLDKGTVSEFVGNVCIDYGNGATNIVSLASDENIQVEITIYQGATVDNITFKPQLEVGDVATEYVPYEIEIETWVHNGVEVWSKKPVPFYIYRDGAGGEWSVSAFSTAHGAQGNSPLTAGGVALARGVSVSTAYGYCHTQSQPFKRQNCTKCSFTLAARSTTNTSFAQGQVYFSIGGKNIDLEKASVGQTYIIDISDCADEISCSLHTVSGGGSSAYPATGEITISNLRCY